MENKNNTKNSRKPKIWGVGNFHANFKEILEDFEAQKPAIKWSVGKNLDSWLSGRILRQLGLLQLAKGWGNEMFIPVS